MSKYSDITFETLQQDMLETYNNDLKTDAQEGSLAAISLSKQAARLADFYADLDSIENNMYVDTMDRENLIEWGAQVGYPIDEGDYAIVTGYLNVECEIGAEFSATDSDYNYNVIEFLGTDTVNGKTVYKYNFEATDLGIDAGNFTGYIEPLDDITNFEEGVITGCVTAGKDAEETEDYRERLLEAFSTASCAGNIAYYTNEVDSYDGFAACKVKRRVAGDEYVYLYTLADGYTLPSDDQINALKEYLDPTTNEGLGFGKAPIGHKVKVMSAVAKNITITASIEYEAGNTWESVKSGADTALKAYFTALRKTWESTDNLIVRMSGIENALISVNGILDASNILINGLNQNLKIDEFSVPIYSSITVR